MAILPCQALKIVTVPLWHSILRASASRLPYILLDNFPLVCTLDDGAVDGGNLDAQRSRTTRMKHGQVTPRSAILVARVKTSDEIQIIMRARGRLASVFLQTRVMGTLAVLVK